MVKTLKFEYLIQYLMNIFCHSLYHLVIPLKYFIISFDEILRKTSLYLVSVGLIKILNLQLAKNDTSETTVQNVFTPHLLFP